MLTSSILNPLADQDEDEIEQEDKLDVEEDGMALGHMPANAAGNSLDDDDEDECEKDEVQNLNNDGDEESDEVVVGLRCRCCSTHGQLDVQENDDNASAGKKKKTIMASAGKKKTMKELRTMPYFPYGSIF